MGDIINFPAMADTVESVCPECGGHADCDCPDKYLSVSEGDQAQIEWDDLNETAFQKPLAEFARFINLEMSEEEGLEYVSKIGFNLIMGPNQTPLGLIGSTEWGWFDTMNCTASFPIADDIIRTVPLPPMENWKWDTDGLIDDLTTYCLTGDNNSSWNPSDEPKRGGFVH